MLFEYYGEPSCTVYAILRATSGYVYNPTTLSLDIQAETIDHSVYAIALTEDDFISGKYTADVVVGSAATYVCEYWQQTGAASSRTADIRLGATELYWDSEKEWPSESLANIQAGTTTTTTASSDGFTDEDRRKLRELYNLRLRTKV